MPRYKYAVKVALMDKSATTLIVQATCQTIAIRKAAERLMKEYGRGDVKTLRIMDAPIPLDKKERKKMQLEQAREHRERHTATYIGLTRID